MDELKPCPFCGNLLEIVHKNGSKYVRCISGVCIFETARHGYHISDDELIKRCNRRPAENALTAEVERLKTALEQIASLRNINPEMKASKFSSCAEDDLRNFYCTMGDIAKMALGKDTDAPAKESEGEDE